MQDASYGCAVPGAEWLWVSLTGVMQGQSKDIDTGPGSLGWGGPSLPVGMHLQQQPEGQWFTLCLWIQVVAHG